MSVTTIDVDAGGKYPVLVGHGLLSQLPELLGPQVEKVLVIHPRALRTTGETVRDDLAATGLDAIVAEIPDARRPSTSRSPPSAGRSSASPTSPAPTRSSPSAGER